MDKDVTISGPGAKTIQATWKLHPPPLSDDQRGPGLDCAVNGRIDVGSLEVQSALYTYSNATATPTLNAIPPRPYTAA